MCSHPSTVLPRPVADIEVKLEPTPLAPKAARRFVARELEALGRPELVEDAQLMVSELVTNSVRYVPYKPLWVDLRRTGKQVILEIWDCSTDLPLAQDPDFLAEGGRGLHVVAALGATFGYDLLCCGKVTWVVLG
jgi:anti-sigma regulatory factor (Ser/Thr protein kinase)